MSSLVFSPNHFSVTWYCNSYIIYENVSRKKLPGTFDSLYDAQIICDYFNNNYSSFFL